MIHCKMTLPVVILINNIASFTMLKGKCSFLLLNATKNIFLQLMRFFSIVQKQSSFQL